MQIEHHQRFLNLFSISNLTCCKFVALKETIVSHHFQSYCSNQTKHTSQGALYGGYQGLQLSEGLIHAQNFES